MIAHVAKTHHTTLVCLVCEKKCRVKCEKCCHDFKYRFSLHEEKCFKEFHSHMEQYIDLIKEKKKIKRGRKVKVQEGSEEKDEEAIEASIRGSKKIKKLEQ